LPVNIDPASVVRATSSDGWSVVPAVVQDNSGPFFDDDRLPGGLESVRLAPGSSVSVVRVRAERWTLTEAGGVVQRLERIESSHVSRRRTIMGTERGQTWLFWGAAVSLPAALLASFLVWATRDPGVGAPRAASMMVAIPLFDDPVETLPQHRNSRAKLASPASGVAPAGAAATGVGKNPAALPLSEESALALAFSSNEAQKWTNGDASGWVVVGPAEPEGGKLCRNVAVLTRLPGEPDYTRNDRRCQSEDATITAP
jgi:hypothetical protein